ncbi:phage major tail tube protein, partial [Escherichia marmotae]|nr:phage major tail tube protein [Escherichia marmotae]
MALPRKLKHLNLFNDGNNWQGIVESLTLPKFTRKYEEDGSQLRFTGSIQRDDTGEVQAVELVVRGRHKELDSGEWKTGESNTTKVTST